MKIQNNKKKFSKTIFDEYMFKRYIIVLDNFLLYFLTVHLTGKVNS